MECVLRDLEVWTACCFGHLVHFTQYHHLSFGLIKGNDPSRQISGSKSRLTYSTKRERPSFSLIQVKSHVETQSIMCMLL